MGFEFCFVFGCPRSGTTSLTLLLSSHQSVVIGMERYKYLLKTHDGRAAFCPPLFEPARFLDFREQDTNIRPPQFEGHYARAERRFRNGTVRYVGDKVPARDSIVSAIEAQFPSPKFVFIYRDLLRVASSFEVRAQNPNDKRWPASNGHELAIELWHRAFLTAEALIAQGGPERIFPVKYERLFNGDARTSEALFSFLGLDDNPRVRRYFQNATSRWDEHQAKPFELSADQRDLLMQQLDRGVLDRFDSRFEEQVARYTGG